MEADLEVKGSMQDSSGVLAAGLAQSSISSWVERRAQSTGVRRRDPDVIHPSPSGDALGRH